MDNFCVEECMVPGQNQFLDQLKDRFRVTTPVLQTRKEVTQRDVCNVNQTTSFTS